MGFFIQLCSIDKISADVVCHIVSPWCVTWSLCDSWAPWFIRPYLYLHF